MAERAFAPIPPGVQPLTLGQVIQDSLRRRAVGGTARIGMLALALLALLGLAVVVARLVNDGVGQLRPWGYAAIAVGYLLATAQAAPLVAITLRLTRARWRGTVDRVAELPAAGGLVTLLLFIPVILAVPSSAGRRTVWTDWPWGAPSVWDIVAVTLLVLSGYALLALAALPDLAATPARSGLRARLARRLAGHWRGTRRQWWTMERGLGILGGFYVMVYVGALSLVALDAGMTLVPGWISAVFPPYVVLTGFECGIATTIVLMAMLRRWGGLARYLDREHFHAMGKLLLAMALMWFYFWWSAFIVLWYGRLPEDVDALKLVFFQTYRVPFFLVFVLNFLVPLLVLMWNRARKSIAGPVVVAIGVMVGTFFDDLRIFSAAYNTPDPRAAALSGVPPALVPGVPDLLILIGGLAGALLLIALALRVVPLPSVWEQGGSAPLRVRRRYLQTEVTLVGKPE